MNNFQTDIVRTAKVYGASGITPNNAMQKLFEEYLVLQNLCNDQESQEAFELEIYKATIKGRNNYTYEVQVFIKRILEATVKNLNN